MSYPNRIKEFRKSLGLTQKQVGLKFREPKNSIVISRWERGINKPSVESLLELARILKVEPSLILIFNKTD